MEALKQFIEVDVFGECSEIECPGKLQESCVERVGNNYWFYLAFENSNCEDYIRDDLWKILNSNIVPVVMGGGNYTRDAPEKSVINVNDFPSVKALADYLIHLTKYPVSL